MPYIGENVEVGKAKIAKITNLVQKDDGISVHITTGRGIRTLESVPEKKVKDWSVGDKIVIRGSKYLGHLVNRLK